MSLESFKHSVVSERLKEVAAHWYDVTSGGRIPSWQDLKPYAIRAHLAIIWAYVYDPDTDQFIGRLAGEKISRIVGKSVKGVRVSEKHSEIQVPKLFERAKRVITEPALFHGQGLMFDRGDKVDLGERVIFPLSTDGIRCDGILGATDCREVARLLADPIELTEAEHWHRWEAHRR